MKEFLHYYHIDRNDWKKYTSDTTIRLTNQELQHLTSLNDRILLRDVEEVYLPMLHFFDLYYTHHINIKHKEQCFLNQKPHAVPFIIGVSGSVAVGKSTTARLLQTMLQQAYPDKTVELMTTDGFLLPTAVLQERNILNRKGFPESYDMERLVQFLLDVKTSEDSVKAPIYSHEIYDIVPDDYQVIHQPDILIVEGINVLQLPPTRDIYVSDFFDWSIYVDAEAENIEQWFLERFELLMDLAKEQPDNYYYKYAIGNREDAMDMAREVWRTINLKNLQEHILPTRSRADFILHKAAGHVIDYVLLKKY